MQAKRVHSLPNFSPPASPADHHFHYANNEVTDKPTHQSVFQGHRIDKMRVHFAAFAGDRTISKLITVESNFR